jgi:hypothetical protein
VIEEDGVIRGNRLDRLNIALQPGSFVPAHMDDFNGNPMILNLPNLGQADVDAGAPIVQPQANLDKIAGNQLVRSSHL